MRTFVLERKRERERERERERRRKGGNKLPPDDTKNVFEGKQLGLSPSFWIKILSRIDYAFPFDLHRPSVP